MLTAEERLMKVLVEGDIILKDATPSYSELLLAVESVIKAQLAKVCPECRGEGKTTFNIEKGTEVWNSLIRIVTRQGE